MRLLDAAKDVLLSDYVSKEVEAERLKLCRACPRFLPKTQQCGICYCFMPMKVKLTSASCADLPPKW